MSFEDYNETTLLSQEDYNETTLLSQEDYNETTLLSQEDYNETTLLNQDDGFRETTILSESDLIPPDVCLSVLSNIITRELVEIKKTVFKIGSDQDSVDFYVNNPTVSRHHMDIVLTDGNYYLIDNNSTNGTTIDGVALKPQKPVMLYDGALIQASEELFQFNIKK